MTAVPFLIVSEHHASASPVASPVACTIDADTHLRAGVGENLNYGASTRSYLVSGSVAQVALFRFSLPGGSHDALSEVELRLVLGSVASNRQLRFSVMLDGPHEAWTEGQGIATNVVTDGNPSTNNWITWKSYWNNERTHFVPLATRNVSGASGSSIILKDSEMPGHPLIHAIRQDTNGYITVLVELVDGLQGSVAVNLKEFAPQNPSLGPQLSLIMDAANAPALRGSLGFVSELGPEAINNPLDVGPFPWATPVATRGSVTYAGWVSPTKDVRISKLQDGQVIESATVFNLGSISNDKGTPSIGIDSDGYIHVAAGMHNSGWEYYVSNAPASLSQGFEKIGWGSQRKIPGDRISYPGFVSDQLGQLYVKYRVRATTAGSQPGWTGVAIAKYNAPTRTWEGLGALAPHASAFTKVVAWSEQGRSGTHADWYQPNRMQMHFDAQNRLHLAWVSYGPNAGHEDGSAGDLLNYAVSDDGGGSFKKANGTPIPSLPLLPTEVEHPLELSAGNMLTDCGLTTLPDGRPVLTYRRGSQGFLLVYQPAQGWISRPLPDSNVVLASLPDGTLVRGSQNQAIYLSADEGQTWLPFPVGNQGSDKIVFDAHAARNGTIRARINIPPAPGSTAFTTAIYSANLSTHLSPLALWHASEGSGTTLVDHSGNNNNAQLSNITWEVDQQAGPCLRFTKSLGSFVNIPTALLPTVMTTSQGTIALWLKTDHDYSLARGHIFHGSNALYSDAGANANGLHLVFEQNPFPNRLAFYAKTPMTTRVVRTTQTFNNNQWTHVAVTWKENGQIRIYVDGELQDSGSLEGVSFPLSERLRLGRPGGTTNSPYYDGLMTQIRMYSQELTDSEVRNIYESESSDSLGAWWKMDEGSGLTLADQSGNGNTGTLSNVAWANDSSLGVCTQFSKALGSVADFPIPLTPQELTSEEGAVSLWMKTSTNYSLARGHLFHGSDTLYSDAGANANGLHVVIDQNPFPNQIAVYLKSSGQSKVVRSASVHNDNEWTHVQATWKNGGFLRLYVNGSLVDEKPLQQSVFSMSSRLRLGRPGGTHNLQYFTGYLSDVRIFHSEADSQ